MSSGSEFKIESGLSVVIPAYNEEESITVVICDTFQALPKYVADYEVIVIDDGSTDKTGEILDGLSTRFNKLRVIRQKNGGFGVALMAGINAATKEYVAYLPADGQFQVNDMRHCYELVKDNDLTLGYRGGRSDYTLARIVLSYGYLTLLTFLFGIRYMDVGWVHIWRTDRLKKMNIRGTRGIFVLTEIVVRFRESGYKIAEGPSYYHPRIGGRAKNANLRVVYHTFFSAVMLWFRLTLAKSRVR